MTKTRIADQFADTIPPLDDARYEQVIREKWKAPQRATPTRRPVLGRVWRALTRPLRRHFLAWRLKCVADDLEMHQEWADERGKVLGPRYLHNCEQQMRDFRSRLAKLDLE